MDQIMLEIIIWFIVYLLNDYCWIEVKYKEYGHIIEYSKSKYSAHQKGHKNLSSLSSFALTANPTSEQESGSILCLLIINIFSTF